MQKTSAQQHTNGEMIKQLGHSSKTIRWAPSTIRPERIRRPTPSACDDSGAVFTWQAANLAYFPRLNWVPVLLLVPVGINCYLKYFCLSDAV